MVVTYETTITGTCPADVTVTDVYELLVRSSETIPVETLLEVIQDAGRGGPAYQEELTDMIHSLLAESYEVLAVQTTGVHSGVRTVCAFS